MKNFRQVFFYAATALLIASCSQNSVPQANLFSNESKAFAAIENRNETILLPKSSLAGTCNPNAYIITLESRTFTNGNWEWVWSVQNPNPGNGNNGTSQNLSHWGFVLGTCIDPASIIEGGYSENGSAWTSFLPSVEPDPSQGCMAAPVIKFDFGTTGSAKSYYRLVVSNFYSIGPALGYYKSGSRTGCCTFNFFGMGCGGVEEVVE